jgi:hypothetical protein
MNGNENYLRDSASLGRSGFEKVDLSIEEI